MAKTGTPGMRFSGFNSFGYDERFRAFVTLLQDCSQSKTHGCNRCKARQECDALYSTLCGRQATEMRKLRKGELLEFVIRFVGMLDSKKREVLFNHVKIKVGEH